MKFNVRYERRTDEWQQRNPLLIRENGRLNAAENLRIEDGRDFFLLMIKIPSNDLKFPLDAEGWRFIALRMWGGRYGHFSVSFLFSRQLKSINKKDFYSHLKFFLIS